MPELYGLVRGQKVSSGAALWRATRPSTLALSLVPFALGALVGWRSGGGGWGWSGLALLGWLALHLGANGVNEWFDFLSGADRLAQARDGDRVTTPGVLLADESKLAQVRWLTLTLFGLAGVCGLSLTFGRNILLGGFFALGGLLAYSYTAPPLKLAYRGHGLGELAALAGYGLLPAAAAALAQTGYFDRRATLIGLPAGIQAAALLAMHHYLHAKSDRLAGKMTPVVAFGPQVTWWALGLTLVLSYAVLSVVVGVLALPVWTLAACLTLIPVGAGWLKMRPPATHAGIIESISFVAQAHLLSALVMGIGLLAGI